MDDKLDRELLCESLITWIQTFGVGDVEDDLTDGVIMGRALHQIAPEFFNNNWLSKIKSESSNNWRLKVSNLKKVLRGVQDFYSEVLSQHIQNFPMPDVNAIGEHGERADLGRLLQLILGCAVNCDNKQQYIERIMVLEESIQHMVMMAIQELINKEVPAPHSSGRGAGDEYNQLTEQLKQAGEQIQDLLSEKDDLAQSCHELDQQVAALQDEKTSLIMENERLNEQISAAENLEDASSPAGRRYQQVVAQSSQLQEDLFRMEAVKEDYRVKVEQQEKDLAEIQLKNEELQIVSRQVNHLKDEIDVLRAAAEKASKYESTVESYKKKLEELSDVRRQVKLLEEKNTSYMQTNLDLEEEVKKAQGYRSQTDSYKRQIVDVQHKLDEATKKADKFEFEVKRSQDKMDALQREKEKLTEERDSLKEINDELSLSRVQQAPPPESSTASADGMTDLTPSDAIMKTTESSQMSQGVGGGSYEISSLPPELKEQFLRLQHENKLLRVRGQEEEEGRVLKEQLDDSQARVNDLQSDNRILNKKILELEAQLEDITKAQSQSESARISDQSELSRKLVEQQRRLEKYAEELVQKERLTEQAECDASQARAAKCKMEEKLSKKEEEMKVMEEKYRSYLDRARMLMKSMSQKQGPASSSGEVQSLRAQLKEKERLLHELQKEQEKSKAAWSQEEKLMTSAWHSLGMQLQMKSCDERLSNYGQSFLARQRQAHTLRGHTTTNGT